MGTRRDVIGYEDVRLLNFRMGSVMKLEDTDPFEVPMYETSIVDVELGDVLLGVRNPTGLCSESESDGPHLVSVRVAPLWQPY